MDKKNSKTVCLRRGYANRTAPGPRSLLAARSPITIFSLFCFVNKNFILFRYYSSMVVPLPPNSHGHDSRQSLVDKTAAAPDDLEG